MRDGRWRIDGTPVVLSWEGVVLDGVQRLLASVEAACPFETLLVEGIDGAAASALRRRSWSNRAEVVDGAGARHIRAVRAALIETQRLDAAPGDAAPPGPAALQQTLMTHPWLGEAVRASLAIDARPLSDAQRAALICAGDGIAGSASARHAMQEAAPDAAAPPSQSAPAIDAPLSSAGVPEVLVETIGPSLASRLLLRDASAGRISRSRVEAMACDIVEGRWVASGQPICLDREGRLLDGRHRLHAIILAGRAVESPVLRGLPAHPRSREAKAATPRIRRPEPFASFGDRALLTAMANLLWRHEMRPPQRRTGKATAAEIRNVILLHPRLQTLRGYARRMTDFGRPSVIGYAAYRIERDDAGLARRFLASLETGADLGPGHPVLTLRNALQKQRIAKASQAEQLALLLAGWDGFRAWCASPRAQRRVQRSGRTS